MEGVWGKDGDGSEMMLLVQSEMTKVKIIKDLICAGVFWALQTNV